MNVNVIVNIVWSGHGKQSSNPEQICFSISHSDNTLEKGMNPSILSSVAQSAGAVEYTDCFSAEG